LLIKKRFSLAEGLYAVRSVLLRTSVGSWQATNYAQYVDGSHGLSLKMHACLERLACTRPKSDTCRNQILLAKCEVCDALACQNQVSAKCTMPKSDLRKVYYANIVETNNFWPIL